MNEKTAAPQTIHHTESDHPQLTPAKHIYLCDRCGTPMKEKLCKISCPNCGNRFDCSDLNIYFD